jgi:hypothetical protein
LGHHWLRQRVSGASDRRRHPTKEAAVALIASAHDDQISDEEIDGRRALTSATQSLVSVLQTNTSFNPINPKDVTDAAAQVRELEQVLVEIEHILHGLSMIPTASAECRRLEGSTSMALVLAERARAEMTARLDEAQS